MSNIPSTLYTSCGIFGWFGNKIDTTSLCGTDTRLQDGKCVSTVDVTSDNASVCGLGTMFKDGKCVSTLDITSDNASVCGPGTIFKDGNCQVHIVEYDRFKYNSRFVKNLQPALYENMDGSYSRNHIARAFRGTPTEIYERCANTCNGTDKSMRVSGCTAFELWPNPNADSATCYYYSDSPPAEKLIPSSTDLGSKEHTFYVKTSDAKCAFSACNV